MSNFVSIEFRANDAQLKQKVAAMPGMIAAAGRAAESSASAAYGAAGTKAGQGFIKGVDGALSGQTGKWDVAGRASASAFGSAVEAGTSQLGTRIAANSTRGITAAMASAGRGAALAFSNPFLSAGDRIAKKFKSIGADIKQGLAIGVGSAITTGAIGAVTGGIGMAASTKNANELDAATRKNATLQISASGGDTKKALEQARGLTGEINKLNKSLGYVSTTAQGASAAYSILSTGFTKNAEVMQILSAAMKGAATDGSSVDTVVDGVTSAIKGLKLGAGDAGYVLQQMVGVVDVGKITMGEYSSLIGKLAPTIGLIGGNVKRNFEQVNAIIAQSTAAGVKPGAAINGLVDALKHVIKPSKEAFEESKRLGLVLNQEELSKNGLIGVLKQLEKSDLSEELKKVGNAARAGGDELTKMGEKPSVNLEKLVTIFGTVEAVAAIATSTGAAGLKEVAKAAEDIGKTNVDKKFGLVMDGLIKKQEAFKNKLIDLDAQLKSGTFAETMAKGYDLMGNAIDYVATKLQELDKWYKALKPTEQNNVKNMGLIAVAVVGVAAALIALGLVISIVGGALAALAGFISSPIVALALVGAALYVQRGNIANFANSAGKSFSDWANGTLQTLGQWGKSFADFHNRIWGWILTGGKGNYDSQLAAGNKFFNDNLGFLTVWGNGFVDVFKAVWDNVGKFFNAIGNAFNGLGDAIKGAMGIPVDGAVKVELSGEGAVAPVDGGRAAASDSKMSVQRYGAGRGSGSHLGEDYSGAVGAPVRAVVAGIITEISKDQAWNGGRSLSKGAVSIESITPYGQKLVTRYFHMGSDSGKAFRLGAKVAAGDVIGSIGADGAVGGNVAHVDIKTKINGKYKDPSDVFAMFDKAATATRYSTQQMTGTGVKGTNTMVDNDVKRVLDLIAKGEVGTTENKGYYKRQNGGNFSADEARRGFPNVGGGENVGRYQVNKGDYEAAKRSNPKIKAFTPEDQDLIAIERLKQSNGLGGDKGWTALGRFIGDRTKANADKLLNDLGAEWEALRDGSIKYRGKDRGKNYRAALYQGQEYNMLGVGQAQAPAATQQRTTGKPLPRYSPEVSNIVAPTVGKYEPKALTGVAKVDRKISAGNNRMEDIQASIERSDGIIAKFQERYDRIKAEPVRNTLTAVAAHEKRVKGALYSLRNAQLGKANAIKKMQREQQKINDIAEGALDGTTKKLTDLELLQRDVEDVNADSGAELARAQLDVDLGLTSEAQGKKKKAAIEQERIKNLQIYYRQLPKLYKKYANDDAGLTTLRGVETGILTAGSTSRAAKNEAGLNPLNALEAKVKAITERFAALKNKNEERRSLGFISEAGAANENSYLSGRLSDSLKTARTEANRLMASYKDPAAIDRLVAITNQIQQQGIEARDAEKARKANSLDSSIESIQKVGKGNATKDYEDQLAIVNTLIKAGLSETEGMAMKLQLQRNLNAALQGSVPFVERFMAAYRDPKAQEVGRELLTNAKAQRAELIALEKEQAKRAVIDNVTKSEKITKGGDAETKDVDNRRALGLISEAKALEEILDIRLKTNRAIQESVASLTAARDLQTDPAVLETYNEELARIRQINVDAQIAAKQYKDTNDQASLQGQIIAASKEGLGDLFRSLGKGAKDLGSILDSILNKIADMVISAAIGSFSGGGSGGGGLLGMIGGIFGFKDGGDVPNGGGIKTLGGISKALRKEGSNAVLATLTPGERVLTRSDAAIQRAMIADGTWQQATKIYGFKGGGDVGVVRNVARSTQPNRSTQNKVVVDRINQVDYVSVDQLRQVLSVQLPAAAQAGANIVERNLQSTSYRQSNGLR